MCFSQLSIEEKEGVEGLYLLGFWGAAPCHTQMTVAMLTCPKMVHCLHVSELPGLSTWGRYRCYSPNFFLHVVYS